MTPERLRYLISEHNERALTTAEIAELLTAKLEALHPELATLKAEQPDEDCDHCHQPFDERGAYCATCFQRALQAFESHTKAVGEFLNELYAVMVDPCAEGTISVDEMKAALLAAAIRDRDAAEKS